MRELPSRKASIPVRHFFGRVSTGKAKISFPAGNSSWKTKACGSYDLRVFREIDRYILREVLPPFGVALLAFLAFISLQVVIYLSELVLSRGAGVGELFRLLGLKLPSLLTLAIPGGVLLAIFWALGRLAQARELLAFQAVGYPLRRIAMPFVAFGAAMSLVSFGLGEFVVPHCEELYQRQYLALLVGGQRGGVSPREEVFFRGPKGNLYYVRCYREGTARGIVVYDLAGRIAPPSGDFPAVITAKEGAFSPGGNLELREGRVLHFDPDGRLVRVDGFKALKVEVGADIERLILGGKTPAQMSLRELRTRIAAMERAGIDPRGLLVEYHAKIAVAASSFLFAFFGAPVGMILGRRGRIAGAAAGFLLAGATQALFLWTKTMARQGLLSPPWGAWLPAVPFVVLGFLLLWRLDGRRLLGLFILLPFLASAAPPPFSLEAESVSFSLGERSFVASAARAEFGDYTLVAHELWGREENGVWSIEAKDAELAGKDISFSADSLRVEFDPEGKVDAFHARDLSGKVRFRGPEKEETLVFVASRADVYLEEGDVERLVGEEVTFTTCPCLPGAPYSVRAERIFYVPDEWLFVRDLFLSSFGVTVWWLPFYVSRLGEEGPTLFPKVGFSGGDLFLKWSFPFTVREKALWGVVGFTFFPWGIRLEPEGSLFGDGGFLSVSPRGVRASGRGSWEGGDWKGSLSFTGGKSRANFSGTVSGWSWKAGWEHVERKGGTYEKAPELALSRAFSSPLGNATLSLYGGRYIEADLVALKLGGRIAIRPTAKWGSLSLSFPIGGSLDVYGAEAYGRRYRMDISPSLTIGGAKLAYSGRWGGGASPLGFDALPPLSRVSLSFSGSEKGVTQRISISWELGGDKPPRGSWSFSTKEPKVEFSLGFIPCPLSLGNFKISFRLGGEGWGLVLQGGGSLAFNLSFHDFVLKGDVSGDNLSLRGGFRFVPYPFRPKRATVELGWEISEEYRLEVAGEYDFPSDKLIQGRVSLVRSLQGCLRVGVVVSPTEVRFVLEVPAFPGAKIRFSPQDEALKWGD